MVTSTLNKMFYAAMLMAALVYTAEAKGKNGKNDQNNKKNY